MLKIVTLPLNVPLARVLKSQIIFSNMITHLADSELDSSRCALVRVTGLDKVGVYCKSHLMSVRLLSGEVSRALANPLATRTQFVAALAVHLLRLKRTKLAFSFAHSEAFRWSHGDADGLPGIVLDDYGQMLVVQSGSAAGDFLLEFVLEALQSFEPRPLFERSSGQIRRIEGLPERTRWIVTPVQNLEQKNTLGASEPVASCTVAGLNLQFTPLKAQKTGLFLDQRLNLKSFSELAALGQWKSMIDLCCYVGAWSCAGAQAGLEQFVLVDQDEHALQRAEQNIALNTKTISPAQKQPSVVSHHGDLFEVVSKLGKEGVKVDVVVADPPAFAKSKKHLPEAMRAYARLTKLGSRLVRPGGLYVACSCSRNVDEADFLEVVVKFLDGADWVLVKRGSQSPDHTVLATDALSEYLKCYFFLKRGLLDD